MMTEGVVVNDGDLITAYHGRGYSYDGESFHEIQFFPTM
jgi:hypothetical protein